MRITNPLNAPEETLAVAAEYRAGVLVTYDDNTGVLTLSAAALGCVLSAPRRALRLARCGAGVTAHLRPRRTAGKDPTTALELALSHVTYQHASRFPDASPRAVTFLVADAAGSSSRPVVVVVNIQRAWLRLAAHASAPR